MIEAVKRITSGFWKELLRGFVIMVATPIAVIIAMATLIGIVPALVVLFLYISLLIASIPVSGIFVASLLTNHRTELHWYHVLLGVLIFEVVTLVPFVGWIAGFIVYLVSLGAFAAVIRERFGKKN